MNRSVVAVVVCAAAAIFPASALAEASPGGGQHTGSAQPFLGFYKIPPILLRNGPRTLLVDPAVKFRDEHQDLVSGGKSGSGPTVFNADVQKVTNLKIYNQILTLWFDRRDRIERDAVAAIVREEINQAVRQDAVAEVVFLRFETR